MSLVDESRDTQHTSHASSLRVRESEREKEMVATNITWIGPLDTQRVFTRMVLGFAPSLVTRFETRGAPHGFEPRLLCLVGQLVCGSGRVGTTGRSGMDMRRTGRKKETNKTSNGFHKVREKRGGM